MVKTINKLTQRSFRLNHDAYMYIICVSNMAAISNMATKKASAAVERSQFGSTNKDFLCQPSLKMAAILNFLVANVCISKVFQKP